MTRLLGAIVYNWPLKLMAIALAALLYAGLVISQNALSRDVTVTIQGTGQPAKTILSGSLGEVSEVRYFVTDQSNVTITPATFTATVDLSRIPPGPEAQSVKVVVESADPRIQVLSATPDFVSVRLEKLVSSDVPVVVLPGTVPDGLDVKPPVPSLSTATVLGAASDVARVTAVRAIIPVDASGIDVDRDFPLSPVDGLGERVLGVEVDPVSVRVTMVIFKDRRTESVPIVPTIVGNLAPGFEVVRLSVSAPLVSLQGDAAELANVATAPTQPISIEGRTADLDATVGFDLPQGVSAVSPLTVTVHVSVRAITESRSFTAGIVLGGARADRTYTLSVQQALLTIGGSPADLDRLSGATLALTANVAGLDIGVHQVQLTIAVQAGLTVVAISPATVTITIGPASGGSAPPSAGG